MGTLFHLVYFLLIGLAAGWIAGQVIKGRSFGLVNDLIVGVIGAFLGGILFGIFGLGGNQYRRQPAHGHGGRDRVSVHPASRQKEILTTAGNS